jgi:DNA helicase-2/ATP-dependent DNA helicase PcrA
MGLADPEEVESSRDDVPGLAQMFGPYRSTLKDLGAVDFDEQVYAAIELLLADATVRSRVQAGCRHLLVDEFQDLTPAHMLLLRLVSAPAYDVFGVGDDDQVIYGHAGADPDFLIDFDHFFPGATNHALEVNYRCPPPVVAAASALLRFNARRVSKVIKAAPPADPALAPAVEAVRQIRHSADGGAEALVTVLRAWLAEPGMAPERIAVLCRVNSLLLAPHVALLEAGIPVNSTLRVGVLDRTGLRAALAYLRLATSGTSGLGAGDLIEVLRRPSRGLPRWFPDRLRRRSGWSIEQLNALGKALEERDAIKLERLIAELRTLRRLAERRAVTTAELLRHIKDGIGLGGAMSLLDSSKGGEGSSHLDDLEALEQVAALHPDAESFETWLRQVLETEQPGGGVTLSSIHRVKGMEWDRVVLSGVNAGIIPHRLCDDEEEERRVLHVAITRCRQSVVILSDRSRPSPFLGELDGTVPARPVVLSRSSRAEPTPGRGAPLRLGAGGRARAEPAVRVTSPAEELVGVAAAVETALRAWRLDRCRADKVSAFIVLYDRTLRAIATQQPDSLAALRRIEGIGPTKLELYGEEILEVVNSAARIATGLEAGTVGAGRVETGPVETATGSAAH